MAIHQLNDGKIPLIEASALEKVYQTAGGEVVEALSQLSFSVRHGEFVSIVGPSGCGKSTLLKILAGLVPPSSGTILMAGAPILKPSPDIAVVFQQPVLLPWRTVLQNVLFPAEIRGLPITSYRKRVDSLLEMVGLRSVENRYPHELSGGMQQRVSIVRALAQNPKLLLMDEPFAALDALTREQMNIETLKIWTETGKTIVFITHSIAEAIFLSDRVIIMTGQPRHIVDTVDIGISRPRALSVINTDEFGSYADKVRSLIGSRERSVE